MAFPTVRATATSNNTGGSNIVVTLPTGHSAGDLLIICVVGGASSFGGSGAPVGWTHFCNKSTATTNQNIHAWWKIDSGSEGASVTITNTTAAAHLSLAITTGTFDSGTAPEVSTGATGSSTAPNPDSLTPSWGSADTLWVALKGGGGASTSGYPTNYSGNQVSSTLGTGPTVSTANRSLTASAEDPGAFTSATGAWYAVTIGVSPISFVAYTLTAVQGAYALTGKAAVLGYGWFLTAAQGAYALTGEAAVLSYGRVLTAVQGAYALTGEAINWATNILLAQGAYALTGEAAVLGWGRFLTAVQGAYALTGEAVSWATSILLASGSYALTGSVATFSAVRSFLAASGSYALTGFAAALSVGFGMAAATGSYLVSSVGALLRALGAATGGRRVTAPVLDRVRVTDAVLSRVRVSPAVLALSRVSAATLSRARSAAATLAKLRVRDNTLDK